MERQPGSGRGERASAEETVERTDFWTPNSQGPLVGKVLISSILEGWVKFLFKFQRTVVALDGI